jgi:glycolate oxidase FAD binding subunit
MAPGAPPRERPDSVEAAAELLRTLGEAGRTLRVRGGATKLGWGAAAGGAPTVEVETGGLDRVLEHNQGDFTAVLQAGVPLHRAQEQFAAAGQMLALDPPLSADGGAPAATIGGVLATADSGPLRHRYGSVRDLVLGITVVLSDGTVARAGGRVIKNVAGYDLGKLFAGSYGTLGLVATVSVRLHPLASPRVGVRGHSESPAVLSRAAARLAATPLEAECLDVAWAGGAGTVLVRFAGPAAPERAQRAAARLSELDLDDVQVSDADEEWWERQRAGQRSPDGAVIKVAALMGDLPAVLEAGESCGATVVSRGALGLSWLALSDPARLPALLERVRRALPEASLTVLDGAGRLTDPWPSLDPGALAVMARIKARFDPARVFAPGTYLGGL